MFSRKTKVTTAALIVAAGRGLRAGGEVPKQYALLAGRPVLARTVAAFARHPRIDSVAIVISPADEALYRTTVAEHGAKLLPPVHGAATRQGSVLAGLRALEARGVTRVLIHDAARPFVSADLISACCDALDAGPAAIAALPMADTVKLASEGRTILETLDRSSLWRAQTPQAFHFTAILQAHESAASQGRTDLTDDAAVAEAAALPVRLVQGSEQNVKLTTREDFALAERMLADSQAGNGPILDIRTGQGFDVHAFTEGDHVWMCGLKIPHTHALLGHSDADAPLHALTDALLGAIADGDIGEHFSNKDPRWRGAPSRLFLEDAVARVRSRGGTITNVDLTILCEAPKISPHRDEMRQAIAGMLGIEVGRVAIKATTTEGLGFTGRREGIAALATATVTFR